MVEDGFTWILMNVYGPAHDEGKIEFLEELQMKVLAADVPIMLGGDFNLVRNIEEKSSGNVNVPLLDAFNEMINLTALREVHRSGSRYTWTNKQTPPIMCVLDRVLISNAFEDKFDLISVFTAPRVGSDHNPLIVDTRGMVATTKYYFRFNNQWTHHEGFCDWVKQKWPSRYKYEPIDHWHIVSSKLRRAIKGWGHNNDSGQKKLKLELVKAIEVLDEKSDYSDLTSTKWEHRYELESKLQQILLEEELYWQRRGGEKWILEGDSNTSFFHKCANGRSRKMKISTLENGDQTIVDPEDL
jgi:hypothetical protein